MNTKKFSRLSNKDVVRAPRMQIVFAMVLITLLFSGCPKPVPTPLKPVIASFTASPASLGIRGGEVTLTWKVEGATSLSISPFKGEVTGTSTTVSIMATTTFTLTASNGKAQSSKSLTVRVEGSDADTTPPEVVSVTPASGAKGVNKDSRIVIVFSERMDQVSSQAAYQSSDLSASDVTFNWNAEGTELTITPSNGLSYATGSSSVIAAKTYAYALTTTATDLAGNALVPFSSSFSTLKAISATFTSEAVRDGTVTSTGFISTSDATFVVGDGAANQTLQGFVSFDLNTIFSEAVGIESADLSIYKLMARGAPYSALEDCTPCVRGATLALDHVVFGPVLGADDFATPTLVGLGIFDNKGKPASGYLSTSVTQAVQDDLGNRTNRENRSQFRLGFLLATNGDNIEDSVTFNSADSTTNPPTLEIVYLVP